MLQETGSLDCSILGLEKSLNYFFMGVHILAQYPTEEEAEKAFAFEACNRTFRNHGWEMVRKIAALQSEVIQWPDWWGNPDDPDGPQTMFITSVDGAHCRIEEPTLDSFEEQRKCYSHKFESASRKAIAPWNDLVLQTGKPFHGPRHD